MYSAVVSDDFHNPRRIGPLVDATHQGTAGTPGEGPYVVLWLRLNGDLIEQAAYRTFGCPAAIASASMLAELTENRTVAEARSLCEEDIVAALDGLPEGKGHCPPLALAALRHALKAQGEKL